MKVHCIEDSKVMQNYYKRVLEDIDFADEIISHYNGLEALNYYKDLLQSQGSMNGSVPDLILLDLNMPVMDGWEFIEEFSRLSKTTELDPYIVVVTSSVDPYDEEKAIQHSEIDGFLRKPFSIDNLEELRQKLNS